MKSDKVTQLRIPGDTTEPMAGLVVAVVAGATEEGGPLVRWGAGEGTTRPARGVWMENRPDDWAACEGLCAVIGFEGGDEKRPILLGLLDAPPEAKRRAEDETAAETKSEVLHLESEKELILECGKAKIALRADGRVVILGGYVLSRSKGVNKIKGGSVQIN